MNNTSRSRSGELTTMTGIPLLIANVIQRSEIGEERG